MDWNAINEKIGADLAAAGDLTLESITNANGQSKKYRSFNDIASAQNIARNQAALAARDTNGIMMRVERDYSDL